MRAVGFFITILFALMWGKPISADPPGSPLQYTTIYTVNITTDSADANIGDGMCDSDLGAYESGGVPTAVQLAKNNVGVTTLDTILLAFLLLSRKKATVA